MSCNPAYVAMESYHQSRPEEATDGSFHQPLSPGTLRKDLVWYYLLKHLYTTYWYHYRVRYLLLPYISLILMAYVCTSSWTFIQ